MPVIAAAYRQIVVVDGDALNGRLLHFFRPRIQSISASTGLSGMWVRLCPSCSEGEVQTSHGTVRRSLAKSNQLSIDT
jgi:hypothetical protein